MIEVLEEFGGSVLCLMEVAPEEIHLYGCAQIAETHIEDVVRVTGLVEKPKTGQAPSNYAVIGRYILQPQVFPILANLGTGAGGEIQLTDALAQLIDHPADDGGGIHAVIFRGKRYDTGDKLSYLKSVISLALDRDEFGPQLRTWIKEHLAGDK
jgi:UTP--glucose-1-phosphate uridylyltransferase